MKYLNVTVIGLVSALTLISVPALASHDQESSGHAPSHVAAPGPLIGTSLPGLAIGYGFWLIRHRSRRGRL